MTKRILLALLVVAASAGASKPLPFQPGKPVEVRKGTFLPTYWQAFADTVEATGADTVVAKRVSAFGLRDFLDTLPAFEADLRASTRWLRAGQVSAISGVVLLGLGAGMEDPSGPEIAVPLFGGLGLLLVGAGFAILSERRFAEAVKTYNTLLPASTSLDWGWTPERSRLTLRVGF